MIGIRTPSGGGHNQSPLVPRNLGSIHPVHSLTCDCWSGVYKGNPEEVDPSTLAQYCAGTSGDVQSIPSKITKGREMHVRHPPVGAALSKSSFRSILELDAFKQVLRRVDFEDLRLAYLGLDLPYEASKSFSTGTCGKGITVPLPHEVWHPRILL